MDAPLRSVAVKHTLIGACTSRSPFVIGGRDPSSGHAAGWDGLIGEVRLCKVALTSADLLWNEGKASGMAVGHWKFEEQTGFFKDSAGLQADLVRAARPETEAAAHPTAPGRAAPKMDSALLDFCHAILNSNEFLYVD